MIQNLTETKLTFVSVLLLLGVEELGRDKSCRQQHQDHQRRFQLHPEQSLVLRPGTVVILLVAVLGAVLPDRIEKFSF